MPLSRRISALPFTAARSRVARATLPRRRRAGERHGLRRQLPRPVVQGASGILCREDSLNHDGPLPVIPNPVHVLPEESSADQRRVGIADLQRTFSRNDDIGHCRKPTTQQEACQPDRPRKELWHKGQLGNQISTRHLIHPIPQFALAASDHS